MVRPSPAVRLYQCAIVEDGGRVGCPCCFSFEIIFLSSEDGTRIDGRNMLQINDHDLLCSYFVCVFVFSFRLPFGAAL
jgi:hypothetical protein